MTQVNEEQTEDLGGLTSPDGINLDDAELARTLPLVCLSLAVQVTTELFTEFIATPANEDALPFLEGFKRWVDRSVAQSNQQAWLEFLAQSRADLIRSFWSAYDPDNLLEGDDEARDLVGDSALGISLFFSFLASTALINERDAERWSNVWSFLAYTDLVTDDESDTTEESQETSLPRRDEW